MIGGWPSLLDDGRLLVVRFPRVDGAVPDQNEEWCDVIVDGELRRIRFHDYGEIYDIPGLYEVIFYEQDMQAPRGLCTCG